MGVDFPRVKVNLRDVDEYYNARVLDVRVGTSHSFRSPYIVPSQREYQYKSDLPTVKVVGAPLAVIDYPIRESEIDSVFGDDRFWANFRRYLMSRMSKLVHVPLKIINVYFEDKALSGLQRTSDAFLRKLMRFYEYLVDSLRGLQDFGPIVLLVQNVTPHLSDQKALCIFIQQKIDTILGYGFLVAPVVDFKVFNKKGYGPKLREYLRWIHSEYVRTGALPFVFIRQRFPPEHYIVSYYALWDIFSSDDVGLLYVSCRRSIEGVSNSHFQYFRFGDLFVSRAYRRGYFGAAGVPPKGLDTSTLELKHLGNLTSSALFLEQLSAMFPAKDFESFVLPAIRNWHEAFEVGTTSVSKLDRREKQEIQEKRRILRAILGLHEYSFGNKDLSSLSQFVMDHSVDEYLEGKGDKFKSVLKKHKIFPSSQLF